MILLHPRTTQTYDISFFYFQRLKITFSSLRGPHHLVHLDLFLFRYQHIGLHIVCVRSRCHSFLQNVHRRGRRRRRRGGGGRGRRGRGRTRKSRFIKTTVAKHPRRFTKPKRGGPTLGRHGSGRRRRCFRLGRQLFRFRRLFPQNLQRINQFIQSFVFNRQRAAFARKSRRGYFERRIPHRRTAATAATAAAATAATAAAGRTGSNGGRHLCTQFGRMGRQAFFHQQLKHVRSTTVVVRRFVSFLALCRGVGLFSGH